MTRLLLAAFFFCCCPTLSAQFTLAADVGQSQGHFNRQPEFSGDPAFPEYQDYLDNINRLALGIEVNFAPATSNFAFGLRLQYTVRGYLQFVEFVPDSPFDSGPYSNSYVDYLDFMPTVSYRINRTFSLSAATYVSIGLAECCNDFVRPRDKLTNKSDYGINLESRLHLGRFYGFTAYQRSLRPFNYVAVKDVPFWAIGRNTTLEKTSGISALRFGVGYLIIR